MEKTALNQLEKWILDYEKVNGTPTMCEIKAQIEIFKEVEKQQIIDACNDTEEYHVGNNSELGLIYFDAKYQR